MKKCATCQVKVYMRTLFTWNFWQFEVEQRTGTFPSNRQNEGALQGTVLVAVSSDSGASQHLVAFINILGHNKFVVPYLQCVVKNVFRQHEGSDARFFQATLAGWYQVLQSRFSVQICQV
jgi:hypothetical protein